MTKLYAITARDRPGAITIRKEKLQDHLTHIEAVLDRLVVAGPLRNEQGKVVGSLLVVKAGSAADARALLEDDPYFKADIWESIDIAIFDAGAGDWVGGKTW